MPTLVPALLLVLVLGAAAAAQAPPDAASPAATGHAPAIARMEELYGAGDLSGALQAGQQLLRRELPPSERMQVLNYLGACCYQLARFADGVAYLQQAVGLLPPGPESAVDRVSLLNDLGECQRAAGQFDTAVRTLEQALAGVAQAAPRTELHARILNNVAGLARDRGDFARTQQLLEEALQITESAADTGGDRLATAHLNLAELLRFQWRLDEARPHYEAALRVARTAYPAGHPNLVYFLNQFALLRSELGAFAAADSLRQEALVILDAQDGADFPVLRAMLLSDAAADLLAAGQPLAAARMSERALELRRATYAAGHWELGSNLAQLARAQLAAETGSAPGIAQLADQAIAILDRTRVAPESRADAHAVRGLARLAAGDRERAAVDLDRAIDIIEELRVHRGGGNESRARLLARYSSYYDEAIDLSLRQGSTSRALAYAERFRARALEEQLLLDKPRLLAAVPPAQREQLQRAERVASSRLAALQDQQLQLAFDPTLAEAKRAQSLRRLQSDLESAVRDYASSQERIRAQSPAWQALLRRHGGASLQQLQSQLAAGELLLLYWVGPAHAWLLEIPALPGTARAHPLSVAAPDAATLGIEAGPLTRERLAMVLAPSARGFGAGPLFEPVRGVSGVVDLPDGADSTRTPASLARVGARLHALWNTLVPREVWGRVRAARQVTIVPAGPLHQLPFEALVTTPPADTPPRYWLDEGPPVRYAVSVSTLLQLQKASRAAGRYPAIDVLSVSNPALGAGDEGGSRGAAPAGGPRRAGGWSHLPALPGTEQESDRVREAFGSPRVTVLTGAAATESAVRRQCGDKRYLHLATHGVVDEATSDVLAGLVLAREGTTPSTDGRLQLYEIDGLRLRAQLAVLSACRTAAGKQLESEGVFALARGFHVAGALRVVASLWSVSDASTAQLMGEFFTRIAAAEGSGRPVDYALALRDAKRAVKAQGQWSHPFYWAPFLLSGAR